MKNSNLLLQIILLLLFVFSFSSANSQWFYDIEILPENPDETDSINLISNVGFNLGYWTNCPSVSYYNTTFASSTILLDLFYDISGYWSHSDCYTVDTSFIGKLNPANYSIIVTINKYAYGDTTFITDSDTLQFNVTNSSSIFEKGLDEYVKIFPNPTESSIFINTPNHLKIESLRFLNLQGKDIREFDPTLKELNLSEFYSGLYLLYILTNEGHVIKKVLVK